MVQVIIVVREPGGLRPQCSLEFDLPEVPAVGNYISVQRLDSRLNGEDMIVRAVWWRLKHSETHDFASEPANIGSLIEIIVECDPALGPYSSDRWRRAIDGAKARGVEIEEFQVSRPMADLMRPDKRDE